MELELIVSGMAAAPVIVGLVAATGSAFRAVPRRMYPALAVAYGIVWQSAVAWALGDWDGSAPLAGIVVGLAASGLYSGAVKPAAAIIGGAR